MSGRFLTITVCFLVLSLSFIGCSQPKTKSTNDVLKTAESLEAVGEKVDYLVDQAKDFYNSGKFQKSISISQYILDQLDSDSQTAKNLLERAKEALIAKVKGAADTATDDIQD
ncbi:MAG: hypothetical protein R6U54_02860 [Candidatus Omnitrophota bacterium]